MNTLILIWIGAVGLAIGSFLNVVIYRLPLKKRFGLGRSICPKCGTQLRWYHNIPLASWAALRGKCAFCRQPISWRYPLVELMTAGAYVYFWAYLGFSPMFFVWAALVSALIVIIFVDLDHQIIPDSITLSGMAAGQAASFLPNGLGIVQSLIGLVVGGGSLYLIAVLGEALFRKEAMGGGDIKMAAMLGAFLGWQKVLLVFLAAAVIGLVVGVIAMLISSKMRRDRMIPFGPYLAVAAVISGLYGDRIIGFYLTRIGGLN